MLLGGFGKWRKILCGVIRGSGGALGAGGGAAARAGGAGALGLPPRRYIHPVGKTNQ